MSDATEQKENGYPEGYDRQDPKTGYLVFFTAASIVTLICLVSFVVFCYQKAEDEQMTIKVQIPIDQDALQLRARENTELTEYGYIDKDKGLVRLPISRAMQLLAAEDAEGKYPFPTRSYATNPLEPEPPVPGVTPPASVGQAAPAQGAGAASGEAASHEQARD